MNNSKIKSIKAREILDSRGNPTIEVDLITELGLFQASVPSGASKGKYEAVELRDGGKRYQGMGVLKAVKNINNIIAPKLQGKEVISQKEIDEFLIKLDGTENKSRLGANAILAISIACLRAGAAAKNIPPYQRINEIYTGATRANFKKFPTACFNVINGGVHAGNELDFQEFMIVPEGKSFREKLQRGKKIYHKLGAILKRKYGKEGILLGYEGGFAPPIKKTQEALNLIMAAIESSNLKNKIKFILDVASSSFCRQEKYKFEGIILNKKELLNFYLELLAKYPIIGLEDPFSQEDWGGWQKLNAKCKMQNANLFIIGDDLLATNPKRMEIAKRKGACNAVIIKPNQIGTISETITAAKLAKSFGWKTMVSHRSGETMDNFIADLAVGIGADFIKSGAPSKPERMAKYNRLIKIEKELQYV